MDLRTVQAGSTSYATVREVVMAKYLRIMGIIVVLFCIFYKGYPQPLLNDLAALFVIFWGIYQIYRIHMKQKKME